MSEKLNQLIKVPGFLPTEVLISGTVSFSQLVKKRENKLSKFDTSPIYALTILDPVIVNESMQNKILVEGIKDIFTRDKRTGKRAFYGKSKCKYPIPVAEIKTDDNGNRYIHGINNYDEPIPYELAVGLKVTVTVSVFKGIEDNVGLSIKSVTATEPVRFFRGNYDAFESICKATGLTYVPSSGNQDDTENMDVYEDLYPDDKNLENDENDETVISPLNYILGE